MRDVMGKVDTLDLPVGFVLTKELHRVKRLINAIIRLNCWRYKMGDKNGFWNTDAEDREEELIEAINGIMKYFASLSTDEFHDLMKKYELEKKNEVIAIMRGMVAN
jgi:hypothetical protein